MCAVVVCSTLHRLHSLSREPAAKDLHHDSVVDEKPEARQERTDLPVATELGGSKATVQTQAHPQSPAEETSSYCTATEGRESLSSPVTLGGETLGLHSHRGRTTLTSWPEVADACDYVHSYYHLRPRQFTL